MDENEGDDDHEVTFQQLEVKVLIHNIDIYYFVIILLSVMSRPTPASFPAATR